MKASKTLKSAVLAAALLVGHAAPVGLAMVAVSAVSAHAAVVSSIEVRGNRRVSAETIRGNMEIRPGKPFGPADVDDAVKRLFATGLFSDVRINQAGSRLIVEVDEYSVVNQVLFQGNKKIKDDVLAQRVQLQPRGTFSTAQMEADIETIRESYRRIGRSDAVVTARTIEVGESRLNVVYEIQENGRTKIATIDFIGNNAYSDYRLRDVIKTKRSNFLSFLFRDDVYDEDRIRADEEALRRFYYNHGYADFRIISSTSNLDDSENEYTITFTVDEGEKYEYGQVTVESSVPGINPDELGRLVETREGKTYKARDVEDTIIALTERAAGEGYPFAQVTPRGDRDFEGRTIGITYTIDQGQRTYVERIEIRGNTRTRDYVIRREFDMSEGDAFNQVLVQRAKRRLEALDFFEDVRVSTAPGSEPDKVVLIVDVVEKSTGEFSIGAGYATGSVGNKAGGFSLELSVTEKNFLGRGQYVRIAGGGGQNSRSYSLSFTEPYFLGYRVSAGFDIYRQTYETTFYNTEITGGSIRFGLPITEALSAAVAYNLSQERYIYTAAGAAVCPGAVGPAPLCPVAAATQAAVALSPWIKSSVSAGIVYDTIDDKNNPRDGIFVRANVEFAGLGGNAKYIQMTAKGDYYKTLLEEWDIVGYLGARAGHIISTGGALRQFDLFQPSRDIIRGFKDGGFGPVSRTGGITSYLGGTTYVAATAEVQFPIPALPESIGVRGAFFADAGSLWGNSLPGVTLVSTKPQWRATVGASLLWQSPFGPLRVDYSVPVAKTGLDSVENFSLNMSGRF